ncbi:CDP-glycerol glycerophosphotransferase family protein [Oceanobacillus sp. FSL K6-3682]|uniref:CDP-glycerol glycerophosphotransferase family protein n=1 Tax=Oceanobacillus sp. FSL K6-3682 TaxID=2921503 RepID=UPI0030DCD625
MKEQIKLISIQEEYIVFEKSRDLSVWDIYLLDEENNKVDIEFTFDSDEITIKNPAQQLKEEGVYLLYINDKKAGSPDAIFAGANRLIIEGDLNSIAFRGKIENISSLDVERVLEGDMPIQKVMFQDGNILLNTPDETVSKSNILGFLAVNEETEEFKVLRFSLVNDTFLVNLSEPFTQGFWKLKILYKFNQYYLMDTIVEGDPNYLNKSFFIGYIGENSGNHVGVYFKEKKLTINSYQIEDFFKEIPVNEREDILVEQVVVHDLAEKSIELRIVDEQLASSKLKEIMFVSRKNKERVRIPSIKQTNGKIVIPLTPEALEEVNNNRWDLEGLFVNDEKSIAGRLQVVREDNEKLIYLNYSIEDYTMMVYTTMNNYIAILKSSGSVVFKEKYKIKTKMKDISKKDNTGFTMTVQVKKDERVDIKNILLKLRSQDTIKLIATEDTEIELLQNQNHSVRGSFQMNWGKDFFPLYWDVFVTAVDEDGNEERIKVTGATNKLKKQINKDYFTNAIYTEDKILYPYVTLKKDIAFMMREKEYYESKGTKLKEKLAYLTYLLMKPFYYRNKEIWIGFEKFSSTAQDNGYAFFQYVDKNKLHDNFYFILDKHSSDYEEVRKESNKVVPFMSFKYLLLLYASDLLVSSENKRHVYNLRVRSGIVPKKIDSKKSIFLQHGVTALKQSSVFKKAKGRGNFSLVIATSDLEEEIIHQNWKYELNEIAVTGFSRWDKLFDKSQKTERRKIFVMPTWRTWMEDMPKEDFKRTDYYDNYVNFLNSKELEIVLEKYNLELVFFLHPKFKQYISEFQLDSAHISLKEFQNIKVNEEIMEASLMISDYSSVTWDMFYMKKPVLFYQFDYEKYEEYEGSYIDMETELFGERALNKEELVQLVQEYAENEFQLKPHYEKLHGEYFKYVDHNNSQRIFDVIKHLK